ncbi:hypothetical protein PP101_46 [Pectobacterium phage PP101]|uniref:Uncharacterized protein n=1 Tax=Pectobacterium phage PP101 TaxID=1916414 RepID=A0A1J0MEV9_9CAUD|nr:hypothetical protein HOR42_gp46 [Pectobacterium phage PP101]APD19703.1 hypothetical protein PP101_46 [Pectobacterium phage PP101]
MSKARILACDLLIGQVFVVSNCKHGVRYKVTGDSPEGQRILVVQVGLDGTQISGHQHTTHIYYNVDVETV